MRRKPVESRSEISSRALFGIVLACLLMTKIEHSGESTGSLAPHPPSTNSRRLPPNQDLQSSRSALLDPDQHESTGLSEGTSVQQASPMVEADCCHPPRSWPFSHDRAESVNVWSRNYIEVDGGRRMAKFPTSISACATDSHAPKRSPAES